MKKDAIAYFEGRPTEKLAAKETLNQRALVEMVSGLDAYEHTPEAYLRTYEGLGIDIVNRVPTENAPSPTAAAAKRSQSQDIVRTPP